MNYTDLRLIEKGFPCHQVGAETQRERGASSALPPLYFLHVWWARRPLTPSRAAIVASLDNADTDPEAFVRQLGIEQIQALVNGVPWALSGDMLTRVECDSTGKEFVTVDNIVERRLQAENAVRAENLKLLKQMIELDPSLETNGTIRTWEGQLSELRLDIFTPRIPVRRVMGNPAWAKELMELTKKYNIRFLGDAYNYKRAFAYEFDLKPSGLTILDPTSGGGSIPFEALRLGHRVIANELNPVATSILYGTLDYPSRYGIDLSNDISFWGDRLLSYVNERVVDFFADRMPLPPIEAEQLKKHLSKSPDLFDEFNYEEIVDYIFVRQVTCPHCRGEAPLLNTSWLSKESGSQWGVRVITDGSDDGGKVKFDTYRVVKGRGPNGEDPELGTVSRGVGQCVHCKQAIDGEEVKAQARGESVLGRWQDRLYSIVSTRFEPVLDKQYKVVRFASGERKGEAKTKKIRFFRPPTQKDMDVLLSAEQKLRNKWQEWDDKGFIPTEKIADGEKTREPLRYGMERWCDMFTPRQLLAQLTSVEGLILLKPEIINQLGTERGKAVITYLQFAIDKCLDYNSRMTLWHASRGVIAHTFTRHDYSMKWTFAEMIYCGVNSAVAWGISQIIDAYRSISELVKPVYEYYADTKSLPLRIINGTAAHMPQVEAQSVDAICIDPPYYNNVMYAELSDFFYVWQRRVLSDIYPDLFSRRLSDKSNEAVANPVRDGSARKAKEKYERMMSEIFSECNRVLKPNGIMTLMFTHKSQDAWETLTHSLIDSGWNITAAFPVESEGTEGIHQKDMAAAASSIFIACRKRTAEEKYPSVWTGLGGQGVQKKIELYVRQSLNEFHELKLNPVDEMVACYGRALRVLSENWPVMDGEETVSPIRAMNEASRVVSENQISKITGGRISVDELDPETAMSLILYGVWGLGDLAYDEALNISKSLNISLVGKAAGYGVEGRLIGINQDAGGRGKSSAAIANADETGFHAPLVRKGSKLRLAKPEERNSRRLERPQTDWDILHGVIQAHRKGDIPVARAYMEQHASQKTQRILDLLDVWGTEMDDQKLREEAKMIRFGLK